MCGYECMYGNTQNLLTWRHLKKRRKKHKQTDNLFQYQIKQKYVCFCHMENTQNEGS